MLLAYKYENFNSKLFLQFTDESLLDVQVKNYGSTLVTEVELPPNEYNCDEKFKIRTVEKLDKIFKLNQGELYLLRIGNQGDS